MPALLLFESSQKRLNATFSSVWGPSAEERCAQRHFDHFGRHISALQRRTGLEIFTSQVSHSGSLAGQRGECCAGDVAGLGSVLGKNGCARFGHFGAVEEQSGESPVDVTPRPNSFHDFLARVAALGKTDVRGFDSCLLRNLVLIEIGSEPWDACFET